MITLLFMKEKMLMDEKLYKVTENEINQRLDIYIASLNLDISRSNAQKKIKQQEILVNGMQVKDSYIIKNGDIIKIIIKNPVESKLMPQKLPIDIVYEDNDILVINKSKGMVVHPRCWK